MRCSLCFYPCENWCLLIDIMTVAYLRTQPWEKPLKVTRYKSHTQIHWGFQNPLSGDKIFGWKTFMQRPFSRQEYFRKSENFLITELTTWRVIENTFGILTVRWGIFSHPINASVRTAEAITKATICLHNFLRLTNCAVYCPTGFADSEDGTPRIKPGEWHHCKMNF